ncbi:MAG: flavodoxin [Clostridia bacterium]|nr:flavodoxin [Clostridia bacterium]MBR0303142.1 flavodoxin [Clostridia bacterium]
MSVNRFLSLLLVFAFIFSLTACQNNPEIPSPGSETNTQSPGKAETVPPDDTAEDTTEGASEDTAEQPSNENTILVVYFSRTGEQYSVGVIDEGNTAIVAKMIAEKTGADMFEILPETDYYPYTYKELTDVAKKEQSDKARPKIKDAIPDLSGYDTVFIGAPVWWGDWPMIMYTFFEDADLGGKTLVPFSTHEGSGLSGFDRKLASAVPGADVLAGLAIRGADCQNKKDEVKTSVEKWIDGLDELPGKEK